MDTIHRNTNKGFDGRWLLVVWGADPGWNPGLSEAEALAGPGRFFNWPPNKSFDPFDFAQGKQRRVARKISPPPCLLSNLELDYESMEKAEIKRKTCIYARCHYGP